MDFIRGLKTYNPRHVQHNERPTHLKVKTEISAHSLPPATPATQGRTEQQCVEQVQEVLLPRFLTRV